jgi:AcrR family transcriptional regulator
VAETALRNYAGKTATERTATRRQTLAAAAFDLIAEEGFAQLRIERVCGRAGLNKRYFYESFADLDAITVAVMEELAGETIAIALAAMDTTRPRSEFVHAAVRALVHHLTEDPRRARVLFGDTRAGEAAARHRDEAIHRIVAVAVAEGRSMHHLEEQRDPVFDLAGTLIVGGSSQAILDWVDGRLPGDIDQHIDDLAALWLVLGDATAARARSRRGAVPEL